MTKRGSVIKSETADGARQGAREGGILALLTLKERKDLIYFTL